MANNNSTRRCDQMEKDINNVHPYKKVKYDFSGDSTTHEEQSSLSNEAGPCTSTTMQEFPKKRIQCSQMENYSYCDTHFASLPEELLVEILRYISISDLWNFCETFKEVKHLLKEQALTRNINLNGWYDVNINSIFLKINPENVTTLNVNYCQWIPREDLLSFVGKCVNLKTLLALGTNLGLGDEDVASYHKTKVNKLAVTITDRHTIARKAVLGSVTHLALGVQCYQIFYVCRPKQFARIFPSLEKVWVDGISLCVPWMHKWLKTYKSSGQIKEQVYHPSRMNLVEHDKFELTEITGASKFYLSYIGMKDYDRKVACFENISNPTIPHVQLDTAPYGRKVAKLLHSGEETLETIQFKELNFYQSTYYHDEKCNKAFQQLLMSPNARNIEKLTLCICLFDDIQNDSGILKEFANLRFLQLFHCKHDAYLSDLQGYNSIGNLSKLRYLFVEIPENCDGKFLFDVLKNCPQLETLRTRPLDYNLYNCAKSNVAVMNHIFKGLEYATNLKELMLEQYEFLNIDDLLSLLIKLNKIKLQKLSLYCGHVGRFEEIFAECLRLHPDRLQSDICNSFACDDVLLEYLMEPKPQREPFNLDLLSEYMLSNPQLVDCRIGITSLTDDQIEFIKQEVSNFNTTYRYFQMSRVGATCKNATLSRFNLMEDIGTF